MLGRVPVNELSSDDLADGGGELDTLRVERGDGEPGCGGVRRPASVRARRGPPWWSRGGRQTSARTVPANPGRRGTRCRGASHSVSSSGASHRYRTAAVRGSTSRSSPFPKRPPARTAEPGHRRADSGGSNARPDDAATHDEYRVHRFNPNRRRNGPATPRSRTQAVHHRSGVRRQPAPQPARAGCPLS